MESLSGDDPVQIAGYQLRARLGAGGMGRVYLAYTPGGRPVALKIMRPEYSTDPDFRERFRHEVNAARRVHALYTAQVLDADPAATPPWLLTAYVPGPSLQQAIAQHGPMPPDSVFQLMAGVAEALGAIHAAGVVHRDLKPSNVILAPDGPRVIDFGIARAADASRITRQGMRVGSPQFMAPEQILGQPPTPAVDVFALGHLTAYAALGHSPFGTGDAAAVFTRILHQRPDLDGCPPALRELIERCLDKDPNARPMPADVVAACREHQTPQTVQVLETWLPPALAAAAAQHVAPPPPAPHAQPPRAKPQPQRQPQRQPQPPRPAPAVPAPPPTSPYPYSGAPAQTGTRVSVSRTTLVRAGVGVAAVGALVGLGVVFLHGSGSPGTTTPPHSASAAALGSQQLAAGSVSPSPTSGLDSCVVGTWTGVTEDVINTINGNPVQFTGRGPTEIYRSDGTASVSYGSGTTLSAEVNGEAWTEIVAGDATSDYQTRNGTILGSDVHVTGTWTLYEDGVLNDSGSLSLVPSTQYTCSGDKLTLYSSSGSTDLSRSN